MFETAQDLGASVVSSDNWIFWHWNVFGIPRQVYFHLWNWKVSWIPRHVYFQFWNWKVYWIFGQVYFCFPFKNPRERLSMAAGKRSELQEVTRNRFYRTKWAKRTGEHERGGFLLHISRNEGEEDGYMTPSRTQYQERIRRDLNPFTEEAHL